MSDVSQVPAAAPAVVRAHFAHRLSLETDCTDVHEAMRRAHIVKPDFVLFDVRDPKLYAARHVPGAINVPHKSIGPEGMNKWPMETLFVVYCAGPHCNAADQAALRMADLGRPVKVMLGGITGWADEGFKFAVGDT
jgi:rhodanese-related sulfurtransferase